MKKLLLIAAVVGLIVVPSIVLARNGADDQQPEDNKVTPATQAEDMETTQDAVQTAGDVTEEQAVEIAKKERSGQTVRKVEIETEDGAKIYSVRFTDDSRVDIRASDGQIVRTETDTSGGSSSDDTSPDDSSGSGTSGRDHPEDN